MKVDIIETTDKNIALLGLGLSYGLTRGMSVYALSYPENIDTYCKCLDTADKLAHKQGGHNKFLESITTSLDITAPRYWWSEFDTYRVGVTKQSESTIHTITKRPLTQEDFQGSIAVGMLTFLNELIERYNNTPSLVTKQNLFHRIKNNLPEGFLQRRIVVLNAKTLQNIIAQRINHRIPEWNLFCKNIHNSLPSYLRSWVFPEGYRPPQESDTSCEEHSS